MCLKDLRTEQIALLRFEKRLTEAAREKAASGQFRRAFVLSALPALACSAAIAAEKLNSDAPMRALDAVRMAAVAPGTGADWIVSLANAVSRGHNTIEALAKSGGFILLQADGGRPKSPPVEEMVRLLLATG